MFKFVTRVRNPEHGSWQSLIEVVYGRDASRMRILTINSENASINSDAAFNVRMTFFAYRVEAPSDVLLYILPCIS